MQESKDSTVFVDLNLDERNTSPQDAGLSTRLSSTHITGDNGLHSSKTSTFDKNASQGDSETSLAADRLLDELLSEPTNQSSTSTTFPVGLSESTSSSSVNIQSPPLSSLNESRQVTQYDQFFEEVSLDLPRDSQQFIQGSISNASKLLKFMPRRTNSSSTMTETSTMRAAMSINTSDISGPFYSISDVLNDSPSADTTVSAAAAAAAAAAAGRDLSADVNLQTDTISSGMNSANARGARRNVYDAPVVATSGGSSAKILKRRSSLNPFTRTKAVQHKPSTLETVVSKTRPRMLPPKDPHEEKKHLQEHEAMMRKARKLEAKKEKEYHRRREEKDKKISQAVYVWEHDILPHWQLRVNEKKTRDLWAQGIPPRCRKRVWMLAIGNELKIPREELNNCLRRVPQTPKTIQYAGSLRHTRGSAAAIRQKLATATEPQSDNEDIEKDQTQVWSADLPRAYKNESDSSYYKLRRTRRTSSLNVLHEDDRRSSSESAGNPSSPSFDSSTGINTDIEEFDDNFKAEMVSEPMDGRRAMDIGSPETLTEYHDLTRKSGEDSAIIKLDNDIKVTDDGEDNEESDAEHLSVEDMDIQDTNAITYLDKAIDEDILRTLPSLCVFQPDGPLFMSLRKVLRAFVGYKGNLTYTRGASFLAGMLLLNMGAQDAFMMLINMIHRSNVLSALYNRDETRVKGYFKIFNVIFAENLPKLYLHFKNLSLTPDNYLPDWFMTVFSSVIPLELSSRLWDLFLLEGDIALFKAGLTVLKYVEPLLWGGSFGETVKTLNTGFVGEERGEEAKAAIAVSGQVTKGEQDQFFAEVMGINGIQLDETRYKQLVEVHVSSR